MSHTGICDFFDSKPFIEAANILVAADEPMRAIQLLENLPGYYRDNPPAEVTEVVRTIQSKLATPAFYMHNIFDEGVNDQTAHLALDSLLRGVLIQQDVKKYNDLGLIPHIVDLGPGEYWLPLGLKTKGYKFTYRDIGLNTAAKAKADALLSDFDVSKRRSEKDPTIFVACELIEHLHHEKDILVEYLRAGITADIIHISTPRYTFDTRKERLEWRRYGDLGHLRTYTPTEFQKIVIEMFPSYNWGYCDDEIMHMRGRKKE